jgi:transcriptional accessory protein Tex/SPT6
MCIVALWLATALRRVGDAAAVEVFATNLKAALLAPPLKHKRVLGK